MNQCPRYFQRVLWFGEFFEKSFFSPQGGYEDLFILQLYLISLLKSNKLLRKILFMQSKIIYGDLFDLSRIEREIAK